MACPCCCPCRSNDQMPCGYEWPTIEVTINYGKPVDWTPPGWPFNFKSGAVQYAQQSASFSFSPVPSTWYQEKFCGWIDIKSNASSSVDLTIFYMPGPLFFCPQDNTRVMLGRTTDGFGAIGVGAGSGQNGVTGESKSEWLSFCNNSAVWSECSISGFDFQDWRWECNKWIIGSFSRSRKFTRPSYSGSFRGFDYTVPETSYVESFSATVPAQ